MQMLNSIQQTIGGGKESLDLTRRDVIGQEARVGLSVPWWQRIVTEAKANVSAEKSVK